MALTPQQRAKLIAISAILAAIAVAFNVSNNDKTQQVHDVLLDAGFAHAGQGGTVADLDSILIQPDAIGTSMVNMMPGDTAVEVVSAPGWELISMVQTGVTVTVTIRNKKGVAARYSGFLHFNRAP